MTENSKFIQYGHYFFFQLLYQHTFETIFMP